MVYLSIHQIRCMYTWFEVAKVVKSYWIILRELREDRDLTQGEIALLLETTQQVYSRYEKGINEMPIKHLVTLANFYNVSADYILGIKKNKK